MLFRTDIEKLTRTPIIAEILLNADGGESIVIGDGKRTPIAEQFRNLRTSLSYIGINADKKTLLFTSSISGEGKSFMAVNMAVSLAITGKKVVLMEFDLRKPKIGAMLNLEREPGISNYLAGMVTQQELIKAYTPVPNLFVITSGAIPPNPTELMLNGKLDALMAGLKQEFDYVLIDCSPVGLVTDAKLLRKYSDATLYMVRHDYTPKSHIRQIELLYGGGELGNMYIVFNGLKKRGLLGYGDGYGYGYGYGYGAGYGEAYIEGEKSKKGFFNKITSLFGKKH